MPYRIAKGPKGKPDGIVFRSFWPLWPRRYRCGHRDAWRFQVRVRGALLAPYPEDDRRCADCTLAWLLPRVIACPVCEEPLFPGDDVWMFHVRPAGPISPDGMDGRPFGCLRMGCAVAPTPESIWHYDGELIRPPDG